MNKHTPGNWYPYFDGEHWNVCLEGAEGFEREIVGSEGLYRCDGSDEANARLIASAPELLEALQSLFGADMGTCMLMDGKEDQLQALSKAYIALAKATGESS